ncbi:hypothetical protein UFOVP223_51 [uncultured Caudovirales phage]|uniref:Uncharacterized protein n=1 Tax=uncultured Caudovirales phage TaxID=2100421 RepID=A0A6J7WNC2_9CAUD|nr:hypothetical protein UFOVP110_113 [uncultured Caudovirales phage]CAB5219277.1 hypothetical protein UFOVP223_51 [uncultured Caudovirales phage]
MLHLPEGKEDWEHTGPYDPSCPMTQEVGSDERNELRDHPHGSYLEAEDDLIDHLSKTVDQSHPIFSALQKAGLESRLENGTMTDNVVSLDEFRAQKAKQ